MEGSEAFVLALGAACGALLLGIALAWRGMIAGSARLPLWHFLRREGILPEDAANALSANTVKQAELVCSVCGSRQECRRLLSARGAAMPPATCPNARLFREFNLWTGRPPS